MSEDQACRSLLAASEEILLLVRADDCRIVDANDFALHALRYERDALLGKPITEIECALQDAFYWDDVAGGQLTPLTRVEGMMACGDGGTLPVIKSLSILEHAGQTMLALRAMDARASSAAADELDASTSLLRAIFESTAEGLLVLELDGSIMNFNHRFSALWALDESAMRSDRAVLRRMVRMSRLVAGASPWRALLSIDAEEVEQQVELGDGRSIRVRARPLLMQDQVRGRVLTCSDVTERIRHERELAAARDAAAASERAKASFLAMMSHEIRTPLAGILGMTEIALERAEDAEQRGFIEMAHSSAESLLVIINDLLDFSKIEAGKFLIETIPFDLAVLLDETLQPLVWQAGQRGLTLTAERGPGLPRWLLGDPTRIRQILINLVGNALKFTSEGGVTVGVQVAGERDGGVDLEIAVRDTGIGIAPERQRSIFEAFTQSDVEIGRKFGGTGLGLTICARLCELMQGTIRVDSIEGEGSTFSFRVPLGVASEEAAAELRSDEILTVAPGLDVLLAEDTEVNQVYLRHTLESAGHRVSIVSDGAAAVARALESAFDVILMDVQMPGMDGFEATEKLRASGVEVPVVGLTAHAMEGIRDECLSHGMTDYLSKPVRSAELLTLLSRIARAEDAGSGAPPGAGPSPAPELLARDRAVANLGGDDQLWEDLLKMLWEQAECDLPLIRTSLGSGDFAQARDASHRLKSSFAVVGADRTAADCRRVDDALRRQDMVAARHAMHALERSYAALRQRARELGRPSLA
ncbi:MAG: response regulator [Rhodocyclaceae bacterium]|nr:response regulator [Rhodocyclaceae bacterium]